MARPLQLCHAKVYDLSLDLVAYLENVYGVTYTMRENQVWEAGFELPAGDDKNDFCLDNHYVELYDVTGARIELFRIISADSVRRKGELYVRYECEHVLATLLDQALLVEMNAGPNTATAITDLLAMQNVAHWQLGTCDFARNFLYYWIEGTSLLAALWSIAGRLYDETWQWTFDTTSHPWTLNLVEPGDDVVAVIDYRLNMEELKRTRQARTIVNRIYPRGNGAGVDQLTIMAVNITGAATTVAVEALPDQKDVEVASAVGFAGGSHVYLENAAGEWEINDVASVAGPVLTMDNDLLHTYAIGDVCHIGEEFVEDATSQTVNGLKEYPWKDERYTIAQNLYDAAIARLAVLKDPAYTYAAKGVDLWPLIGEHRFQLGELVRVRDNELDVLIDARVTVLKQRDVTGKPQSIEVQFDNKIPLFGENLGDIIYADDLDGVSSGGYYSKVYSTQVYAGKILLSAVPGGPIGSMPNPPAAAGTYLSAEYIGIHNGTDWITYMDNAARLIADDGTGDAYFRFDPTLAGALKLQIRASGTWVGDVSIANLTAGTLGVAMNVNVGGLIKSHNYVHNVSGWQINPDGSAEFQDATIRGTLSASDLTLGTLAMARIAGLAITGSKIAGGTITYGKLAADSVRTNELYIDGTVNFKPGATFQSIQNIDRIYGDDATHFISLWTNSNIAIQAGTGNVLSVGDSNGLYLADTHWTETLEFVQVVANDALSFDLGHEGYIQCLLGAATRYIAFRKT